MFKYFVQSSHYNNKRRKSDLFRSAMDISLDYFPTPMMIWTILILVLCSDPGMVTGDRACKQGFIQYYHTNQVMCCKPTRCDRGHKVTQCSKNETEDSCTPCHQNHNQSVRTSSYDPRDCQSYPLDQNCRKTNTLERDLNDQLVQGCMCDVEKGFYFKRPEVIIGAPPDAFCQPNKKEPCGEGLEPTLSGNCKKCDHKYFKSEAGFRLCEQKTDCSKVNLDYVYKSSTADRDNKCSEPEIVTTPKPTTKKPVKSKPEPPDPGSASTRVTPPSTTTASGSGVDGSVQLGSSLGTDKNPDGGDGESSLTVPILITVIFLVVVILVIAVILFTKKRKGLTFCCGSTKTCSDLEKNMRHNQAVMAEPHQRNKILLGNCSSSNGGLTQTGDKVMNNNTSGNGRLTHFSMPRANGDIQHESVPMHRVNFQSDQVSIGVDQWTQQDPNSQHRVRHASFPGEEHSLQLQHQQQGNMDPMFPPSSMFPPSPTRHPANVSPRPGILRNGGPSWKHGQVQAMDSIGREKLQVQMLGREANMEAGGENDPLLVSEGQNQGGARRATSPHSAQGHYHTAPGSSSGSSSTIPASPPLVQGGMNPRQYLHHPLANSNSLVPEVTFAQQPTYGHYPPKVVATFTRSSSVIATPEGEVDEDDMEAIVPRFSQLLPDMDGGENTSTSETSPDQEEATQDPRRTADETSGTTQQLRSPNQRLLPRATPGQERAYHTPALHTTPAAPPAPRRGGAANQPDHHIMNLKEQQLQESLTSGPSSSLTSQLKFPSDSDRSQTEALKTLSPEEAEPSTQETTLKTHLNPLEDSHFSEETEQKKQSGEGVGGNHNSLERKRNQAARDRRRMASGGSTNSNSSRSGAVDRHHNLSNGEQTEKVTGNKTVNNSSSPPASTTVKVPHTSHPVPFDGDGDPGQDKEATVPHKVDDLEQTQQKQVSRDGQVSSSSSVHSSEDSPTRANAYHRSQSENISSGSESPHRPPPRSNSEEKPQGSNRPVAKVRPMPASDSPVPGKSSEGARPVPGAANILSYSSEEDSDDEEADSGSVDSCLDEVEMEAHGGEHATQRTEDRTEDHRHE